MSTPSNTGGTPEQNGAPESLHRRLLEHRALLFAGLTTVGISVGGIVEIVPMYSASAGPESMEGINPYTPLELAGRDIYIREGCYNCHSQMIRPMRAETLRYGEWTRAGEVAYDHPFQLGSRRIGPDLQREGGRYPDSWHYEHMRDPRSTSPGSIMPPYPRLYEQKYEMDDIVATVGAMQTLGVPYTDSSDAAVRQSVTAQAGKIVAGLKASNATVAEDDEIVAMIAYLQRLGVDGKAALAKRSAK